MLDELGVQLDRLRAKREAVHQSDRRAESEKLISFYTRLVTKATDAERCSVFIHDPEKGNVWLKAGTGVAEHQIEVPKEGSVVGKVISSGEPVIVTDLNAKEGVHKEVDHETGFVTRNILCVPIKSPSREEITGAFQLLNKEDGAEFTQEDLELAQEVAGHLQVEVDRIFLDQEVFGLTERVLATARKTMKILVGSVAVLLLLIFLIVVGYFVLPVIAS